KVKNKDYISKQEKEKTFESFVYNQIIVIEQHTITKQFKYKENQCNYKKKKLKQNHLLLKLHINSKKTFYSKKKNDNLINHYSYLLISS
ncbi:hypothetical protein RFI_28192, partial [Reticulomyxa filosa]